MRARVNKVLKPGMTLLAIPLLLAAAPAAPKPPAYQTVSATVQIVAAEEIRFEPVNGKAVAAKAKGPARQSRTRDGMPMVEFY